MLAVRDFKTEKGISSRDVIAAVKEVAPKFDKTLLCKVEAPEKYGVCLVPDAEQVLEDSFGGAVKKPRNHGNREKPCRLYVRLGKMKMRRLMQAMATEGFETMQECLEYIISTWLEERNG